MALPTDSRAMWSEEATQWWTLLHGDGATAEDRREFFAWVSRSPERIEAYLGVERLMSALRSREMRWPDTPAEVLIREARDSEEGIPVTRIGEFTGSRAVQPAGSRAKGWRGAGGRGVLSAAVAAAAAAVAAAVIACWVLLPGTSQHYATGPGEQRSILLADGSRLTLNSASSVAIDFRKHRRIVRLLRGEALFQVAHDPARPFDVYADGEVVRAIGTEFNVDMQPSYATLTVLLGRVAVMSESQANLPVSDPRPAAAGTMPRPDAVLERFPAPAGALIVDAAQEVRITAAGLSGPQPVGDPSESTAWTRRELVFEQRPLGAVADEIGRDGGARIVIESAALRARHVTGVIQLDDSQSLLEFLSGVPGVVVRRKADGTSVVTLERGAAK